MLPPPVTSAIGLNEVIIIIFLDSLVMRGFEALGNNGVGGGH